MWRGEVCLAYTSAWQSMIEGSHCRTQAGAEAGATENAAYWLAPNSHAAAFLGEPRPIFLWMAPPTVGLASCINYNQENAPVETHTGQDLIKAILHLRVFSCQVYQLEKKKKKI